MTCDTINFCWNDYLHLKGCTNMQNALTIRVVYCGNRCLPGVYSWVRFTEMLEILWFFEHKKNLSQSGHNITRKKSVHSTSHAKKIWRKKPFAVEPRKYIMVICLQIKCMNKFFVFHRKKCSGITCRDWRKLAVRIKQKHIPIFIYETW